MVNPLPPTPPPTPIFDRLPDRGCHCCKLPVFNFFSRVIKNGEETFYCSKTCYEKEIMNERKN